MVIIYGSDMCVLTPRIGRVWVGFYHRVACRLVGGQPQRGRESVWVYPPLESAMAEAGLQEVETYVSRRQNIVAQFVAARTIMKLFLVVERSSGSRVTNWWW